MVGRHHRPDSEDPWAVLGLRPGSSASAIREARRGLAKQVHPDVGGTAVAMQRINAAAAAALGSIGAGDNGVPDVDAVRRTKRRPERRSERPAGDRDDVRAVYDHPSFTIEALPAEAFEGLLVVASWLGTVVLDDPPYEMEIALDDPVRGWCRLDIVPDAGSSTVSLAVAAEPGHPRPGIDEVRDSLVRALNQLDWSALPDRDHRAGPLPS